jgi:hypothetical protein
MLFPQHPIMTMIACPLLLLKKLLELLQIHVVRLRYILPPRRLHLLYLLFQAWDDDFEPAEAVETVHPSSKANLLRPSSIGSSTGVAASSAYPRNKTPDGGVSGAFGVESPWLGSSGNMFGRNGTPDLNFGRNVTPDVGSGAIFGGGGVMNSSRKLQEVLAALSSLRSVRTLFRVL